MKKDNKIIYILDFFTVIAIVISVISTKYIKQPSKSIIAKSEMLTTYLNTNYLAREEKEKMEIIEEDISLETVDKEVLIKEEKKNYKTQTSEKNENKKEEEASIKKSTEVKNENSSPKEETKEEKIEKEEVVLEKLVGALAGYGPDCYGCTSFRTSSGKYIGDGNIYYDDKEYGKIRILAGDKSYPYGTIVKMTNTNYYDNSPIYAVVLDRGGGVVKGKKFLFDLLFETEKEASKIGSRKNVTFEILRLGY